MRTKPSGLRIGDVLADRYRLVARLGEGGMSSVFLAEDLRLNGKKWAVKECLGAGDMNSDRLSEAEADMLVQLQHPYLPRIVDYVKLPEDGSAYIVMDYISGTTLLQRFESQGKTLPMDLIRNVGIQLCELFDYLHTHPKGPIIYRDLKPSNVMLDESDHIKLIDFGIARSYREGIQQDTMQIGTFGFAAPEQFGERQTDARTDLYALGALLYYLLSGGRFYYLSQVRLELLVPEIPSAWSELVHKLLESSPEDRWQSAAEVKIQLESFIDRKSGYKSELKISETSKRAALKAIPRKMIVIGSLYAGAGSTFVSMALAKVLNLYGVPHAVVEFPYNTPEYFSLLNGNKRVEQCSYISVSDAIAEGKTPVQESRWQDGQTLWFPLSPDADLHRQWKPEHTLKLLYAIKEPIVLIDISHSGWEAEEHWLSAADEIVLVADPTPSKNNDVRTNDMSVRMERWKDTGKNVRCIANKAVPFRQRAEWLRTLPENPVCTVPYFSYTETVQALWQGELIQQRDDILKSLSNSFYPLLVNLIPKSDFRSGKHLERFSRTWLRMFQRRKN